MSTLTVYRRDAAKKIGLYHQGTATSGSTGGLLEDTAWPIKSSVDQSTLYVDQFVYRPSAAASGDKTRLVSTYDPATGQITVDLTYSNVAYSGGTGETYEIHGIIPPATLHECIDEALKRIPLVVEFTFTPTANATRHSMATAASWLTDPKWVYQVGYLSSGEARAETNPYNRAIRGEAFKDSSVVYLNHHPRSFNTTDTMYVLAMKPAYNHCRASGGSYGDQSGLTLETDEAVPQTDWVTQATLVEVWDRYRRLLEAKANEKVLREASEAASRFSYLTRVYFTPPAQTFRSIVSWGPSVAGGVRSINPR